MINGKEEARKRDGEKDMVNVSSAWKSMQLFRFFFLHYDLLQFQLFYHDLLQFQSFGYEYFKDIIMYHFIYKKLLLFLFLYFWDFELENFQELNDYFLDNFSVILRLPFLSAQLQGFLSKTFMLFFF